MPVWFWNGPSATFTDSPTSKLTFGFTFSSRSFICASMLSTSDCRMGMGLSLVPAKPITPGVIGFAGTKDKPIPMRQSEVDSMLAQMKEREEKVKPKVSFEVGETVKVADGPFQNQNGIVEEIDPERGKLRVSVTIFGRATPVELEYWQVERG